MTWRIGQRPRDSRSVLECGSPRLLFPYGSSLRARYRLRFLYAAFPTPRTKIHIPWRVPGGHVALGDGDRESDGLVAVAALWSWGTTNITDLFLETPTSKFVAVPSYPKGVWQTVRFEIDLASWRYNFYRSEKGQPASVILTNLVCASPRFSRITSLTIDRYSSFTTATDFYIDNIVVSAGPPAAVTPAHAIVTPGGSVTLSPTNILAVPSSYQWQFNGTDLPGQTGSTLTLNNVQLANEGLYTVAATDAARFYRVSTPFKP